MLKPSARRFLKAAFMAALYVTLLPACGLLYRHRNRDLAGPVTPGAQPDKILYEKATNEIAHGRYDVGRLTLQTLINTYPDSEYLAKAKLAIADSYYKEGGVSGLTEAEIEYKDFITFFPTAPEAPEAQFRVGMAHFHLMGKPDRDRQEALQAEAEFKEFLLKYPDSPLMPRAKARLREVQEVLGQSDHKIAKFYYAQGVWPAARGRFQDIVEQYPNFSQADEALWYLGQTYEHLKQANKAAPYYGQIISDYPLSSWADDARQRLAEMHQPIPRPSKAILARARADAQRRRKPDLLTRLAGIMSSAPDTTATRHGPVHLGPKPGTAEAARMPQAPIPAGANIVVQPLNDESLKSGKAVDGKPASGSQSTAGQQETTASPASQQGSKAAAASSTSDPAPPAKKKKKSFFKKLLLF
jgi:outer membrane protein assembly factor BamD